MTQTDLTFDRFTEPSRMVLLFARASVAELGGTVLKPEHILLGLLQTNPDLVGQFMSATDSVEAVVGELSKRVRDSRNMLPEDVEIPMTTETETLLLSAVREASISTNESVSPTHLLLALAADEATVTSAILRAHGITAKAVRAYLDKTAR